MYIISEARHGGPQGPCPLGRTVPQINTPHENVLQSYRHKRFNTQLQEYTEVPGEAIWWHRMQEKPSAAGALPRTPLGSLQCPQARADLGGGGKGAMPPKMPNIVQHDTESTQSWCALL